MKGLHSYPSIFNLGHRQVQGILDHDVVVQEKVDGSQFSFGVVAGALKMRSKGAEIFAETTDKLFQPAVDTALRLFAAGKLREGWTYRGEAITKPKHNSLCYDRTPKDFVMLFDIDVGEEAYLTPAQVREEIASLDLEFVPVLHEGKVTSLEQVHEFIQRVSALGGANVEGVVIKAYGQYGADKKTLMAKYVSEAFKEVHKGEWRKANPTKGDVIELLIQEYCTPARWNKAIQHLRERGELQDAPQDIGKLMQEIPADVEKECADEIREKLWQAFWPDLQRGVTRGFPQWYKDKLAEAAFVLQTFADLTDPR